MQPEATTAVPRSNAPALAPARAGLVRGIIPRLTQRPILIVGVLALAIQLVSAARLPTYVMPNAALAIASNLASSGRYEGGSWVRLKGTVVPSDPPLRSYHLPGEPLYLAAGLALRRPAVFTYWHVPVAVLLVVAAAASACVLFGPEAALITGVIAAVDPLIAIHGPVYDDTFLAAALFWLVAVILLRRWAATQVGTRSGQPTAGFAATVAIVVAAGWAAVTRSEALVALAGATLGCLALPALRSLRRTGAALCMGLLLAVGGWTARNAIVQGHLLMGSSHDGITLWESNEAHAPAALALGQVDGLSNDSAIVGSIWHQTQTQDEVGANRTFERAAIRDMEAHPLRVAAFAARKVATSIVGLRPELPTFAVRNVVSIMTTALLALAAALAWSVRRRRHAFDSIHHAAGIAAVLLGLEVLGVLALGPVGVRYWVIWRPVLWVMAGSLASPGR